MKHQYGFTAAKIMTLMLLGLFGLASAQDALLSKPFNQWTKSDANKLLTNSPWAKVQEGRFGYRDRTRAIVPKQEVGDMASMDDRRNQISSMGGTSIYKFSILLRSALPIRQALVRLRQLDANYDQMSEADRKGFDAKTKVLLECPACASNYVVAVSAKQTQVSAQDPIYLLLRDTPLETIKPHIYLENDKGERREVIHIEPPKGPGAEATLFFPRLDAKGNPLVNTTDKKLIFRMGDTLGNEIADFSFDVSKLISGDKVEF